MLSKLVLCFAQTSGIMQVGTYSLLFERVALDTG